MIYTYLICVWWFCWWQWKWGFHPLDLWTKIIRGRVISFCPVHWPLLFWVKEVETTFACGLVGGVWINADVTIIIMMMEWGYRSHIPTNSFISQSLFLMCCYPSLLQKVVESHSIIFLLLIWLLHETHKIILYQYNIYF